MQLDAGDSDPATFFYYLRQAAPDRGARRREPLPLLAPEYRADIPGFARRWFRELFARLLPGAVVALDGYQTLAPDSELHRALAAASEEIPRGAQLLVMSWGSPPAELGRALADERLGRISPEALHLTVDEAEAIAASGESDLTTEQIREMHRRCGGWAAGFTLLRERTRRTGLVNRVDQAATMQEVFDYFMAQVFRDAPPEERQVLLGTAVPPRFTEAMAIELTGSERAVEVMERLHRRHLFVQRRYGAEVTYEYHSLFRAFLLDQATRPGAAPGIAELSRRAAVVLEKAGMAEDAVPLLRDAGDHAGAARLLEALAPAMAVSGRGAALASSAGGLPDAERDRRPWLSYWLGVGLTAIRLADARAAFERAHAGFVRDRDRAGRALAVVGVLQAEVMHADDPGRLEPWVSLLDQLFAEEPAFASADVAARAYGSLVSLMTWALPAHPLFGTCIERLEGLLARPLAAEVKVTAGGQLAEYYGLVGFVRDGERVSAALESLARDPSVSPQARAYWHLRTARSAHLAGDFETVRRKLGSAIDTARDHGLPSLSIAYAMLADLALDLGELEAVPPLIERMRALAHQLGRQAVWRVEWTEARLASLRGDLDAAMRHLEVDGAVPVFVLASIMQGLTRASIATERGELDRARTILDEQRGRFATERFPGLTFRVVAQRAVLEAAAGGLSAVTRAELLESLRRLQRLGGRVLSTLQPGPARQIAELLLAEDIETPFVRSWIRRVNLRPRSPDAPSWPWAVRVHTLGAFRIEVDGAFLGFSRKAPRKPLELLQALVAFGGRDVPAQELCHALWPDSDGGDTAAALRMTLTRLRKLLGRDAVALRAGRVSLDDGLCWVDASSLERTCAEVERQPTPARAAALVQLYGGPFLAGEREQPWVLPARERLRRRFVAAIGRAGKAIEREGRHAEAIELYRKALEQDDASEAIHRGLIAAHLALGQSAEALAAYQRCRRALRAALGVGPSAETEALRARIGPA
ncbi:MAG: hypothetical protein HZB56_15440 [Deltaproteobacteria bacterium]|nr:hypothetical protein [Deltaproteobacteria bacterium]